MIIPKKQMQKIAEEIGETIHKNINIMDETGCIIASTDAGRIGMFHTGAIELLNSSLPELIIEKDSNGAKNGINLPLTIEDKNIGVVGITGRVEEVRELGNVIKKMTEIMILDWCRTNQKKAIDDQKRSFAVELLFGDDEEKLEFGIELLGMDMGQPRIVVVTDITFRSAHYNNEDSQEMMENITRKIKKSVESDNKQQLIVAMGMKVISIYNSCDVEKVYQDVKKIKGQVETAYPCILYSGIGSPGIGKKEIQWSYKEAGNACGYAKIVDNEFIKVYSNGDLRLLLTDISPKKRSDYLEGIYKNCDDEQIGEINKCLKSYLKNNGSIQRTAQELYIHKNTLQYRLGKIKSVTGYDPRILNEAIPLIMAVYLKDFVK